MGKALIIDDFLDDIERVRAYASGLDYRGVTNPADGVFYSGVAIELENRLQAEYVYKLSQLFGREITPNYMFFRLSTVDSVAPYQAHTDAIMGTHAAIVYLNTADNCQGGTELVRHIETGMDYNPKDEIELALWEAEQNMPDKWEQVELAEMAENRLVLIDAALMHRSRPIGGYGHDISDGRIVVTCFFSVEP